MLRPRIDRQIHALIDRRIALLRDVERSGGRDVWSHLHSHGHRHPTVRAAIHQGYLRYQNGRTYHYEITDAGRRFLADIDRVRFMEA